MMNSLNIDCLIEIVKLLNLRDQISVYQANSSLQVAVTTLWLMKYKHIRINFLEVTINVREFAIFIEIVREVAEVLHLRFLDQEKYEIMKKMRFERVCEFRFTLSKPYFMQDSDLKDLCKMLPNLTTFSPHGNFSGLYMDEWPLLKDLNLSYCFKLEMPHFQRVLRHLKLEKLKLNIFPNNKQFEQMNLADAQVGNLKYLQLNTYELYYFLATPLTSLKELVITNHYNPRQLFDVLLSVWKAKDILLVETANVDNILVNCLEMQFNVEQLTIVNDENALTANIIPSLHLLTALRKLRFKNCSIKTTNFINLLKNIPQVHEVSFESCQFDAANICLKIGDIFANRMGNLRLNMFENRPLDRSDAPQWCRQMLEVIPVLVEVVGNHKLFNLTNLKGENLCYEPLYVVYR